MQATHEAQPIKQKKKDTFCAIIHEALKYLKSKTLKSKKKLNNSWWVWEHSLLRI